MTDPEAVGSVAEEAFKLFRAMSLPPSQSGETHSGHVCTETWCPVCQVVGFVRNNPDAVTQVSQSAAVFARSLRDLIDSAVAPKDET